MTLVKNVRIKNRKSRYRLGSEAFVMFGLKI